MGAAVADFIVFDDDKGGNKGKDRGQIQDAVDVGTLFFLFWGMGRLKKEDCLGCQEDTSGIEELETRLASGQLSRRTGRAWGLYWVGREKCKW